MTTYLAEYKTCVPGPDGTFVSVHVPIEADTLQMAQREVEKVLASGCAEEAILYQPAMTTRAARVVTSTSMSGSKTPIIGSALQGPPAVDEAPVK